MPQYCFCCDNCENVFVKKVSMDKIEKHKPQCPKCKSKNTYREYSQENVSVNDGIKTLGSYADRNADKMSLSQKIDIDQRTRGADSPLKK